MSKKYRKGKQITSMAEFEQSGATWFIVTYGGVLEKTTHKGWLISWQYRTLKAFIDCGYIYEAEEINHG